MAHERSPNSGSRDWITALAYRSGEFRRYARRLTQLIESHGFAYAARRALGKSAGILPGMRVRIKKPLVLVRATGSPEPVSFPSVIDPIVSIVIPCHGQVAFTLDCLKAIRRAGSDIGMQVIVVDDASPESVADAFAGRIQGVHILRNEVNRGFGASSNQGALCASGNYLVFLNNDTEVQPGWLEALLGIFERYPDAGLAGSRLVYPDGRLQEAGGRVFPDGSAANCGRGGDPQAPPYRYVRQVDYCSGACIMVPRMLFASVGGFDPAYAPAYYEDTDLAFKIRQVGKRVYYEPHSLVLHHEGASAGRNPADPLSIKHYQDVNREVFRDRWATELKRHAWGGAGSDPDHLGERRKRVLWVDATPLTPDRDSGSLRACRLLELIREEGFHPIFCPMNLMAPSPYLEELEELGVEYWHAPYVSSVTEYLRRIGATLDLVILSRLDVAQTLLPKARRHAGSAAIVFDTVDLHHLRFMRQAEQAASEGLRRHAEAIRAREFDLCRQADATLVVSDLERTRLIEGGMRRPIHVLSNIHEPTPGPGLSALRCDIVFIGSFRHPPNMDALGFLVREIWPQIAPELPEARLVIVGQDPPRWVATDAESRIEITGYLPDLAPVLDRARVMVAPLRVGAGVKGKVTQALALGIPVVATTVAIEGIPMIHERSVLVADDARDFARSVIRLYRDPGLWETLRAGGLEITRSRYSKEVARAGLRSLLGDLGLDAPSAHAGESDADA